MPENNENNNEDIRDTQQEIMSHMIAFSANLSNNSTLKVLDYIINASTTATSYEIAQGTGLSERSACRHLRRLKKHPIASRMFSHASRIDARPRTII